VRITAGVAERARERRVIALRHVRAICALSNRFFSVPADLGRRCRRSTAPTPLPPIGALRDW